MATVKMNGDVITSIVAKVRALYELDRAKADNDVPPVPEGLGEEIYSLLMPAEDRKKVSDLLPAWMRGEQSTITLRVLSAEVTNNRWCPVVYLPMPAGTLALNNYATLESVPGTSLVQWDGVNMTLYLNKDWSALPTKHKEFIGKVANIAEQQDKITRGAKAASGTMQQFLEQHRTVQSAMKAFGPAIKTYIDPWLQQELDRVPAKRAPRTRVEKEKLEINVAKLVAKATATQLNIN